jgi:hypothetical protein
MEAYHWFLLGMMAAWTPEMLALVPILGDMTFITARTTAGR